MGVLDPNKPQVTDPTTVADLVRFLQIRGDLGMLELADIVLPTVSLGSIAAQEVDVRGPAFSSADVFSVGMVQTAAANLVLADTGALPAGIYDIRYYCEGVQGGANSPLAFQHRNAANAANLAVWEHSMYSTTNRISFAGPFTLSYQVGLNERLRIVNGTTAVGAGLPTVATIFARIRS